MPTTYTPHAQFSNATVTVTTSAELSAALASLTGSGGGTILLDPSGGPYDIFANGLGDANNPVLIKGLDPTNPPLVTNIYLLNSSYITMTGLLVDSSSAPSGVHDLRVSNSDHIEFVGNVMTSTANGYLDSSGTATKGASAVLIRNSSDILFADNTLSNYYHGAGFLEVTGLRFEGNELFGLQGDGFRAGGLVNATISNNYMHDFYGSDQTINHSDFIQIWSTNATIVTSNVEISGNILDTSGNAISQGIFIGNEQMRGGGTNGSYYDDIRIHDNVIHAATWHGIAVEWTTNAQVYDNAVLLDDKVQLPPGSQQPVPWILISNSPNASAYGNLSSKVTVNGIGDDGTQNRLLDYSDPATAAFIDNYMASLPAWSSDNPALVTGGWSPSGQGGNGGSTTAGGSATEGAGTPPADTGGAPEGGAAGQVPPPGETGNGGANGTGSGATPPPAESAPGDAGNESPGGTGAPPSGIQEGAASPSGPQEHSPEESARIMSAYQKTVETVISKFGLLPDANGNLVLPDGAPPAPTIEDVNNLFLPPEEDSAAAQKADPSEAAPDNVLILL